MLIYLGSQRLDTVCHARVCVCKFLSPTLLKKKIQYGVPGSHVKLSWKLSVEPLLLTFLYFLMFFLLLKAMLLREKIALKHAGNML